MIFVDTSVWVEVFRTRHARLAGELERLIDAEQVALAAPVRVELLAGAPRGEVARLRSLLSALPACYPTASTWARIDAWVETSRAAGERFGVADLLIAAIAAEQGGRVWSLDSDFGRMARLGLVGEHRPQA